jgi:hypothetical protein
MWSFNIEPAKCRPLMTYASTVHTTQLFQADGVSSGTIAVWNDKRAFLFPWKEVQQDLGPYDIRVTPSTQEGTALTDTSNVWQRRVTVEDACPISVVTVSNANSVYELN